MSITPELHLIQDSIITFAHAYGYPTREGKNGEDKIIRIITGDSTFVTLDLKQDWLYGTLADDTTNNVNGDMSRPEDVAHLMLKLAQYAGEGFSGN